MLRIQDPNSGIHFVAAESVALISQAGNSAAWHGIRSHVKLFDGTWIDAIETPEVLAVKVTNELAKKGGE